jgi:hypothetical protein
VVITNVTDATLVLAETLVSAKAGTTDLVVVRVVTAPDDATETNLVEPLLLPMFLNITVPDTDGTTPDPDSFGTVSSATPTPGPVFETISDDPSKLGSTAPEAPKQVPVSELDRHRPGNLTPSKRPQGQFPPQLLTPRHRLPGRRKQQRTRKQHNSYLKLMMRFRFGVRLGLYC